MGQTIQASRTQNNVPIGVVITRDGGITGLTILFRLFLGSDRTFFLDFNDGVFKAAGHTTTDLVLDELGFGEYVRDGGFDLSGVTIPVAADHLLAVYDITAGGETGNDTDTIQLIAATMFVPVIGIARNITAGDRLRLKIHLAVEGERVALPDAARLALELRDRANALLNSASALTPVAGSGEFSHEFDPIGFAAPAGDVISAKATITLSGFGPGTHVGQLEISIVDLGV